MAKKKIVYIRVTEEQDKELIAKAHKTGFTQKADYVRYLIFTDISFNEKIDRIYEKVCRNG